MIQLKYFLTLAASFFVGAFGAIAAEPASSDTRIALPDQAAREKSSKMIQDVFGARITAAKTPADQQQLASELSKIASETTDDPNARFLLWQTSVDVATKAGEYKAAYYAAEEIANHYQIDRFVALPRVLANLTPRATAKNYPEAKMLYTVLTAEAVNADRFDVALSLCEQFSALTQRYGDATAKKEALAKSTEIQGQKKLAGEIAVAKQALESNPNDPGANEILGKYYFEKGNWKEAFAKLALANDANLKSLGEKGLAAAEKPETQLELADLCWKLAETARGTQQLRLQQFANICYSQALPTAVGLDKAKIEVRLKELAKNPNLLPATPVAAKPSEISATPNPNFAHRAEMAKEDLGIAPVLTEPEEDLKLTIISARWGGGKNWKDVTEKAQEAYAKNRLTWVWATPDYLKSDPTPGWRKKLEIQYEINNKPYKAHIDEGGAFKPSVILKKMREEAQ